MIKHNQDGAINGVVVSLILTILILVGAIAFAGWAYNGRQDYKLHSDQKVAVAVTIAKQQESTVKDKQFAEAEKRPLRTYTGPAAYGSVVLQYPKTWSGIVDDTGKTGNALVDGYFFPNIVPSITSTDSVFSLRIQVLNQPYTQVVQTFTSLQQNKQKPVTITPYALPKLPKVVGVQLSGALPNQKSGVMIVLPLRSYTIELWTEGSQFTNDFNGIILPNFSFSP